jgi:hypothetical protein
MVFNRKAIRQTSDWFGERPLTPVNRSLRDLTIPSDDRIVVGAGFVRNENDRFAMQRKREYAKMAMWGELVGLKV